MDSKELRNSSLSANVSDDASKYAHSSATLPAIKNKSYNDIGTSSISKVDGSTIRPCAIIGPDRVVSHASEDFHLKKPSVEPWPYAENIYRQPPDYPTKPNEYHPTRNISPRQTFQENMQRIMVSPIYSSVKNSDDSNLKSSKINMPQEAKYCDVPYNINTVNNDHKSVRNSDIPMSSVNPSFNRSVPPYGWPTPVNIRPPKPYGAPEFYQYSEYANCGPRPMTMTRPLRSHHEETTQTYPERLYQEANIRFKPYPPPKDKHQQMRYDYINNYQNTFHPPVPIPPHKYDLQKPVHGHPYPVYPQIKYLERRIHDPFVDGYQRPNQNNFNAPFRNQIIPPPYGPLSGNCVQNKPFTDISSKSMTVNKHLAFDSNNKIYLDLEPTRKAYPMPENIYYNDMNHIRSEMVLPNHSALNMHTMPQHQIYRRDNPHIKPYDYNIHYRNIDQSMNLNYSLQRLPLQFSPNAIAISPSDSNTSIDTIHAMNTSQEDCGYVSQSSTTSVRSLDSSHVALPNDFYKRRENPGILKNVSHTNDHISRNHKKANTSDKKNLDVRQFLQMWNEGEDEVNEPNKDLSQIQGNNNLPVPTEPINNQEQLYVLGLVNVPSEELSKYEHIQKISKLPENIKGYNSIEILNQYEKFVESSNANNHFTHKHPMSKEHNLMNKRFDKKDSKLPRPVSPLDVEAKISQSVIHKEVGCNFEIKPCSPEMLNVEIATPVQTVLGERIIEKVTNPIVCKSPMLPNSKGDKTTNSLNDHTKVANCNIINNQYSLYSYPNLGKPTNYNVPDFNTGSGISLASLPRLDNDIELNFPEINQQFITANKIESETVLPSKDLPRLDIEEVNSIQENNVFQQNIVSSPVAFCPNVETESTKLSKYRKNKKPEHTSREENLTTNKELISPVHQRIDSVIIKNPDNIKLHENIYETTLPNVNEEKLINNQYETEEKSQGGSNTENDICNLSFDTAIDFSLSKNDEGAPCNQLYDTVEKSKNFDSNCQEAFDYKDNIKNESNCTDGKVKEIMFYPEVKKTVSKDSLEYTFEVNEYLQSKLVEESSVPVIKELSSELDSSIDRQYSTIKENDTSVIRENNITSLDIKREDLPQQHLNTEKEINSSKELLNSNAYVENEDKIINSENIQNLKLELNVLAEKETEIDVENKGDLKKYDHISLKEDVSSDSINHTGFDELKDNISDEHQESITTNKLVSYIDIHETSDTNTLFNDASKLNDDELPLIDKKIMQIAQPDIKINETNIEIKEIINSQNSSTNTFNNNQTELVTVPENKMNVIDPIGCKDDEDNVQMQTETVVVENTSHLESNDNTDIMSSNIELGTDENDRHIFVTQDFLAKEILNEEILKSTDMNKNIIKNNKVETNNTKEETNNEFIDRIVSPSPYQRSSENPDSLNLKSINKDSNSNLKIVVAPTLRVYKELYSPWIQKLYLFSEGYYNSMPEVPSETPINLLHPLNINNNVENSNNESFLSSNSLPPCDSNISENKETITVNFNSTDTENDSCTADSADRLEVIEKDNFVNLLCDNNSPVVFRRKTLKRCLSDSALHDYKSDEELKSITPIKRKRGHDSFIEPHVISEDICNIIQNNRRNSVSTFYNDNSLYIVIENDLIITEGNEDTDKIYISEMTEDLSITESETTDNIETPIVNEIDSNEQIECVYSAEKSIEESWVEDVACIETVVSEDVLEDFELNHESPKECEVSNEPANVESLLHFDNDSKNNIENIHDNTMTIGLLETLHRTSQIDVINKTLQFNESSELNDCKNSEEASPNQLDNDIGTECISAEINTTVPSYHSPEIMDEKENIAENVQFNDLHVSRNIYLGTDEKHDYNSLLSVESEGVKSYTTLSCQSPDENSIINTRKGSPNYSYSSSPEVSSTTSEEKNSSILLKITNYNGSRMSQINEVTTGTVNKLSYKLTENKEYRNYNSNFRSSRTLITKAAQKYIPPIKNTIRDLKIKLPLPEHRLNSLKQLKTNKVVPKIDDIVLKINEKNHKQTIPKKQKPKFEDVLKSIDEIQLKKNKNRVKKSKNVIPKVIIKKNENGAHYASTNSLNNTDTAYNPDLTGRKWQPWVFLEKNNFIDRMAVKNKIKAVYCHRKKTYVLAEKFKKYKSIYNANFVISQPNTSSSNKGNLKYTIRLKHI